MKRLFAVKSISTNERVEDVGYMGSKKQAKEARDALNNQSYSPDHPEPKFCVCLGPDHHRYVS
jgi:hypothetical protein